MTPLLPPAFLDLFSRAITSFVQHHLLFCMLKTKTQNVVKMLVLWDLVYSLLPPSYRQNSLLAKRLRAYGFLYLTFLSDKVNHLQFMFAIDLNI